MKTLTTVPALVAMAVALGAEDTGTFFPEERKLVDATAGIQFRPAQVRKLRRMVRAGTDPLGQAYCDIRAPEARRPLGQTYTSATIVDAMVGWAAKKGSPDRVVDPGVGSGRYLVSAGRRFPYATLCGVDIDPLATLMARANLAANGMAERSEIVLSDYRSLDYPKIEGQTLFIGNPPYVRHHLISTEWKEWLSATASQRGIEASRLSGLHAHFFLATAEHAREGDFGTFITSSEWLDVNYGKLIRKLLLDGLGGQSLHIIDAEATPFSDALTTGTITCFRVGDRPEKIRVRRVESAEALGKLGKGKLVPRERLVESSRWSTLTLPSPKAPEGYVELGEICRVHRGAVTGANAIWVQDEGSDLPEDVLFPTITRARELFGAGSRLENASSLRKVVDLPVDLDVLESDVRAKVERFLEIAREKGVHEGYVASNRKAWWSVGLKPPAPILATYMARRPPAFVRNVAGVRHINIAHGLYPRDPMSSRALDHLAEYLRSKVSLSQGRTYAGGLVKFEPREMERILVPSLEMLEEGA